jgi:hypothetical protein
MSLHLRDEINQKSAEFWDYLDRLVAENAVIIERPKGSSHPHFTPTILR